MKPIQNSTLPIVIGAMLGASATGLQAADLEFSSEPVKWMINEQSYLEENYQVIQAGPNIIYRLTYSGGDPKYVEFEPISADGQSRTVRVNKGESVDIRLGDGGDIRLNKPMGGEARGTYEIIAILP